MDFELSLYWVSSLGPNRIISFFTINCRFLWTKNSNKLSTARKNWNDWNKFPTYLRRKKSEVLLTPVTRNETLNSKFDMRVITKIQGKRQNGRTRVMCMNIWTIYYKSFHSTLFIIVFPTRIYNASIFPIIATCRLRLVSNHSAN